MPTYLLFIPGAVALLIALLYLVAGLFGAHIAQVNRDNRYRKAELRSEQRAREIYRGNLARQAALREAQQAQELRHKAQSGALDQWQRDFYNMQQGTYFNGVR